MLRTLVAAVPRTAASTPLGACVLTVVLGTAPLAVLTARGDARDGFPVILATLALGATLGWAADDPARELLAATPVGHTARTGLRTALTVLVSGSGLVVASALLARGPRPLEATADRFPELLAAAMVALAVGFAIARRGDPASGALGVMCGVAGPVVVAALAARWPGSLPSFTAGPAHVRWWLVAVSAALVAGHQVRDPGRP